MKGRTYWVKVDKSSGEHFWYKDHIGEEFEVTDYSGITVFFSPKTHYTVVGDGENRVIAKKDTSLVKTFKVRVNKAESHWFWYAHQVGAEFEVINCPNLEEQYWCVDPDLRGCLILKKDASVVEEPMEYKDLKDWADKAKYVFGTKIWYDDNEECVIMGVKEGVVIVLDVKHDTWDAGHIDGYTLFYIDKEDIIWEQPTTMTHDLVASLLQDAGFLKGKLVIKG